MSKTIKTMCRSGFTRLLALSSVGALTAGCGGEAEQPASQPTTEQARPLAGKWEKVWGDEFDGDDVKAANWSYNTTIHVNDEQQRYTKAPQNVSVRDGMLRITARFDPAGDYAFTSGRLESQDKREFGHARVEARIRMPVGPGLWPAFWMLGADINSNAWPGCGEIDIMENVGYANWYSGALHGPGYSGATPIDAGRFNPDPGTGTFHVYGIEYSATDIKWFLDGKLVSTVTKGQVLQRGAYVFDKKFFIILNLAVGGGYPQSTNGATSPYPGVPRETLEKIKNNPQTMEVDWVRVYQLQ